MSAPAQIVIQLPATGVVTDFESLMTKFCALNSVRYEHFLEIWQEMRMPLTFSGRQNDRECREFTEECLKIALSYLSPNYQFQVRVCGIYLLFGIYFKHPFHPKVKIRVTSSDWQELLEFLQICHEQKHLDVEYVFTRLRQDRAFHFVATKVELHPGARSTNTDSSNDPQQQKLEMLLQQKSIISEVFASDTIDQLAAIHEEYHRVKCGLAGPNSAQPEQSLNVIENGLIQMLTKSVTAHEDWRKTRVGKKLSGRRRRDSGGFTTSESEAESEADSESSRTATPASKTQGLIRAEIKARAFSSTGPTSSSRRYRKTVAETPLSPDGESSRRKSTPRKKKQADTIVTETVLHTNEDPEEPSTSTSLTSMPVLITDEHQAKRKVRRKSAKKGEEEKKRKRTVSDKTETPKRSVGRPKKDKPAEKRSTKTDKVEEQSKSLNQLSAEHEVFSPAKSSEKLPKVKAKDASKHKSPVKSVSEPGNVPLQTDCGEKAPKKKDKVLSRRKSVAEPAVDEVSVVATESKLCEDREEVAVTDIRPIVIAPLSGPEDEVEVPMLRGRKRKAEKSDTTTAKNKLTPVKKQKARSLSGVDIPTPEKRTVKKPQKLDI